MRSEKIIKMNLESIKDGITLNEKPLDYKTAYQDALEWVLNE